MADTNVKKWAKLKSFVEAALTNPRHPIYEMGLRHSPMLQHYAVNVKGVGLLETITAEEWFESRPAYAAKLRQVIKLCEEAVAEEQAKDPGAKLAALEADNAALKQRIADMDAKLTKLTAAADAERDDESDEGVEESDESESDEADEAAETDEGDDSAAEA